MDHTYLFAVTGGLAAVMDHTYLFAVTGGLAAVLNHLFALCCHWRPGSRAQLSVRSLLSLEAWRP